MRKRFPASFLSQTDTWLRLASIRRFVSGILKRAARFTELIVMLAYTALPLHLIDNLYLPATKEAKFTS